MCAEQFMAQVTVAMFYVDEVETRLRGNDRSLVEIIDDSFQFRVGEHRIIRRNVQATIKDRMVIEDLWLRTIVRIWATISTGVRELQTDKQTVVGTGRSL